MSDFEALVREHQAAVCATAYAVLRDRSRSEEIAQDAFLVAWQKLPALSPPPPLPAWICGIARNLARNAARKRRETAMTEPTTDAVAAMPNPLDATLSREHAELASGALATLSDDDRELVSLYYRCDESIADVAAALAISEVTARKRLQRTRQRLRSALASVEAMLRATRPGPAFTVACVAALAAGRVPDAAAAEAATAITARKPLAALVLGGAALVVVIASVVAVRVATSSPSQEASTSSAPSSTAPESTRTLAPADAAATRTNRLLASISAAERAAVLSRVRAKRAATVPPAAPFEAKVFDFADVNVNDVTIPEQAPADELNKKTLRYAIKLMHPMLLACRGDATARGRLAVKLRLAGEDTGTVVESVEITGEPPLSDDAELVECVRTTLESLELPPMHDVVPWDIYYPFVF